MCWDAVQYFGLQLSKLAGTCKQHSMWYLPPASQHKQSRSPSVHPKQPPALPSTACLQSPRAVRGLLLTQGPAGTGVYWCCTTTGTAILHETKHQHSRWCKPRRLAHHTLALNVSTATPHSEHGSCGCSSNKNPQALQVATAGCWCGQLRPSHQHLPASHQASS